MDMQAMRRTLFSTLSWRPSRPMENVFEPIVAHSRQNLRPELNCVIYSVDFMFLGRNHCVSVQTSSNTCTYFYGIEPIRNQNRVWQQNKLYIGFLLLKGITTFKCTDTCTYSHILCYYHQKSKMSLRNEINYILIIFILFIVVRTHHHVSAPHAQSNSHQNWVSESEKNEIYYIFYNFIVFGRKKDSGAPL